MTIDTANERKKLAGLDGHTEGPWHLCVHLKDDEHCKCGYRGVVYGPDMDRPMAICQPGHDPDQDGQEGLGPVRYPREIERANSRLIAAAPDLKRDYLAVLDALDAKEAEIERLCRAIVEANSALDDYLGDTDLDHFESGEEMRDAAPVQWAAMRILAAYAGIEP